MIEELYSAFQLYDIVTVSGDRPGAEAFYAFVKRSEFHLHSLHELHQLLLLLSS